MFDDFYGLTEKPFQLTPDPAFYFRSATHRKALSYLGYGLGQGEGFIVITGEVGAGKSTLVAHLTGTIDPQRLTVGQVVSSRLDATDVVQIVARSFGLEVEEGSKASALGAIEDHLHCEAHAGRRCLLIVDESQALSIEALEELRMLSNFRLGNQPLLQTLLVGQPEFRDTLQGHAALEQLRQRIIAAHHLEPLERGETEAYVAHRLARVGWRGNPQFEQRVFGDLHEASGGIPRRINQIANRLLLLGAVEQATKIDAVMLGAVLDEMAAEWAPPEAATPPNRVSRPKIEIRTEDRDLLRTLLAERDVQIAELQQAIVELAYQRAAGAASLGPEIAALAERVARLEAQAFEQERAIRQTLTMLIDWIEDGGEHARAA